VQRRRGQFVPTRGKNMLTNYTALNPTRVANTGNHRLSSVIPSNQETLTRSEYWDSYYGVIKTAPPSQFAAFIAGEFPEHSLVIDIGCGNGRDTVFFAQMGFKTIGIDGSASAIKHCKSLTSNRLSITNQCTFIQKDVAELSKSNEIIEANQSLRKILYSRFFLHAINPAEEKIFLDYAFSILRPNDVFALEFRTSLDEKRKKETNAHYRRYIDVPEFIQHVTNNYGASIIYMTEGSGFAKYKNDDAHVCRLILSKGQYVEK
jgi:SAM-dependent methyltransferase